MMTEQGVLGFITLNLANEIANVYCKCILRRVYKAMNELVLRETKMSKCESSKLVREGEETVKQEGFPKRRKPKRRNRKRQKFRQKGK